VVINVSVEEEIDDKKFRVVQRLEEAECVATVQFCNWFQETVCGGEVDPLLTYVKQKRLVKWSHRY
jgi:hypothetical protein